MEFYSFALEHRPKTGKFTQGGIFITPQKRWLEVLRLKREGSSKYGRIFLFSGASDQIVGLPEPAPKPKKSRASKHN